MSATRWTPGPWKLLDQPLRPPPFDLPILEIQSRRGKAIVKWVGFNDVDRPRPEVRANARLMTAAPDLFEALRCLLEDDRFQVAVGGNPIAVDEMLAKARAALARARGETGGAK